MLDLCPFIPNGKAVPKQNSFNGSKFIIGLISIDFQIFIFHWYVAREQKVARKSYFKSLDKLTNDQKILLVMDKSRRSED